MRILLLGLFTVGLLSALLKAYEFSRIGKQVTKLLYQAQGFASEGNMN
ncbi:MAG: hypothetical protein ACI934_000487 [Pseudohongiellaceae bacterium]|jgi:hypothetical protein